MEKEKEIWGKGDAGCYADSVFGDDHLRAVMADLVQMTGNEDLAAALRSPDPDDDSGDDVLNALDELQRSTADGLTWILHCGDLLLVPDEEDEPGA